MHRQVVRKPHEAHDIEINPVTHLYFVEVDKPDMHDPSGDLERLKKAVQRDWQLRDLHIALPTLQSLQKTLRDGDWKVTVAVGTTRKSSPPGQDSETSFMVSRSTLVRQPSPRTCAIWQAARSSAVPVA